jgi:hypothetical protein
LVLLRTIKFFESLSHLLATQKLQNFVSKCDWNSWNQHARKTRVDFIGCCHDIIAKWHYALISFAFFAWNLKLVCHTNFRPHKWYKWGAIIDCTRGNWHCWRWWRSIMYWYWWGNSKKDNTLVSHFWRSKTTCQGVNNLTSC